VQMKTHPAQFAGSLRPTGCCQMRQRRTNGVGTQWHCWKWTISIPLIFVIH